MRTIMVLALVAGVTGNAPMVAVDGSAVQVRTVVPGKSEYVRFVAAAGAALTVGVAVPRADGTVAGYGHQLSVRDPAGTTVAWFSAASPQVRPAFRVPVPGAAVAGTYTIELTPVGGGTVGADVSVSSRRDLGDDVLGGPGAAVRFDRVGQEQELRVDAGAGGFAALRVTGFDLTSAQAKATPGFWAEVWRPGGAGVAYRGVVSGDGTTPIGPLGLGGHVLRVWPVDASAGAVTVGLARAQPTPGLLLPVGSSAPAESKAASALGM